MQKTLTIILEEYFMLKRYSYYFIYEFDNINSNYSYILKLKMYLDKSGILKYLLDIDPKLATAYHLTSMYREFNKTANINNAKDELENIIETYSNSSISYFNDCAKTLTHWKECILNSFIEVPYSKEYRRLSNSPC